MKSFLTMQDRELILASRKEGRFILTGLPLECLNGTCSDLEVWVPTPALMALHAVTPVSPRREMLEILASRGVERGSGGSSKEEAETRQMSYLTALIASPTRNLMNIQDGELALLLAISQGEHEIPNCADLIVWAAETVEEVALYGKISPSVMLSLQGTIAGYALDLCVGPFASHAEIERMKAMAGRPVL